MLSWYSEWIDHFECGVRYLSVSSAPPRPVLGALVAEDRAVMQRRAEHRQPLAQLEHPGVIEIEVLAARERVPRLLALDVGRERRVAAAVGLDPRPLGRGDHRPRLHLCVGERDPVHQPVRPARSASGTPVRASIERNPSTASRPLYVPDS